jgi:hypothetical protein
MHEVQHTETDKEAREEDIEDDELLEEIANLLRGEHRQHSKAIERILRGIKKLERQFNLVRVTCSNVANGETSSVLDVEDVGTGS